MSDTASEIVTFLQNIRDDRADSNRCIDFLYRLLRKPANETLPLLELVIVLKNEKPILYSFVKPRIQHTPRLKFLFELSLDYEQAKERLNTYVRKPLSTPFEDERPSFPPQSEAKLRC